jgi:signal transduction histidine kinase/ActR/RegA family two-component response regulator
MAETTEPRQRRKQPNPAIAAGLSVLAAAMLTALLAMSIDLFGWTAGQRNAAALRLIETSTTSLLGDLLSAETAEHGFRQSASQEERSRFIAAQGRGESHAVAIQVAAAPFPALSDLASAFTAAARTRMQMLGGGISAKDAGQADAAAVSRIDAGRRATDSIQGLSDALLRRIVALRVDAYNRQLAWRLIGEAATVLLSGAALLVLITTLLRRRRAEDRNQAGLEAMMASAAAGLAVFDTSLRCQRCNAAFAELLPPQLRVLAAADASVSGATLWDMLPQHRADLEPVTADVLLHGRRIDGVVLSLGTPAGRHRDWAISLKPLLDAAGAVAGLGLTCVEVTAQRAAERRLAFQLRLEERLRDLADPTAMKQAACALLADELGVSHASYSEVDERFSTIIVESGYSDGRVAEASGRRDLGKSAEWLERMLRHDGSIAIADARCDPRVEPSQYARCYEPRGIVALAMVTLLQRNRPAGLIFVSHPEPRQWSDADMALLRDVADRSWSAIARGRAALALRDSEQRFQRAVAGAAIGIWDWDLEQNRVTISRGFLPQAHEGLQGGVCTADDFLAAIHQDDRNRMAAAMDRVVEQARAGEPIIYEAEYRTVTRHGRVLWLRSQGRVTQKSQDGRSILLSGVTVEVTARRRAEEALTAAQDRLRILNQDLEAQVRREVEAREQAQSRLAQAQRLEALSQLSAGIAHDFNNVLQAITGSLALIQRRAADQAVVTQLAGIAGDAAARGTAITARLLSFARQGDLQPVPVPPGPLLHALLDMLEHQLGQGIDLRCEAGDPVPPLLADKGQLEAVLVNLVLNAGEAMPSGGTLTIAAHLETVGEAALHQAGLPPGAFVRIDVTDTGVGMQPAVLARASEPFFTTKPLGQGAGLGLAMARGFAEQSGGAFLLNSTAGAGTTVSLWLPVARQEEEPAGDRVREGVVVGGGALHILRNTAAMRLLLVDDDALVREVLAGQLEELGYRVSRAHSGAAALARLDAGEDPHIMVSDYAMPGMNGAVLLAEARRRRPDLPVLLLTGFADSNLRINMEEWDPGITLLLRKPVSQDRLAEAVQTVLRGAARPAQLMAE